MWDKTFTDDGTLAVGQGCRSLPLNAYGYIIGIVGFSPADHRR